MRRDSEIEQQVLRSLKQAFAIASKEICVESQDGLVTLSGSVRSQWASLAIDSATSEALGVRGVVNNVQVKGGGLPITEGSRKTLPTRLFPCGSDSLSSSEPLITSV